MATSLTTSFWQFVTSAQRAQNVYLLLAVLVCVVGDVVVLRPAFADSLDIDRFLVVFNIVLQIFFGGALIVASFASACDNVAPVVYQHCVAFLAVTIVCLLVEEFQA